MGSDPVLFVARLTLNIISSRERIRESDETAPSLLYNIYLTTIIYKHFNIQFNYKLQKS